MSTIKTIIYNLKNKNNQEFDIFNDKLKMKWTVAFDFADDCIFMTVDDLALTRQSFSCLTELENHLNKTFFSEPDFKLN